MNQPNTPPQKNIYFLLISILSVICVIAVFVLLYFSLYAPTAEEKIKYSIALVISGVFVPVVLFLLFIYGLNYVRILKIRGGDYWVRWEYPKDWGKGDVYFCSEGVYDADKPYSALDTFGSRFVNVEIPSDDPSMIRFSNRQFTGNKFQTTQRTQEVPIPPGKEEEAKELVGRFREYIGSSSKYTKDQWRYVFPLLGVILLWAFLAFQFVATPAGEEMRNEKKRQWEKQAENRQKQKVEQLAPLWNKIRQTLEPKFESLKNLPDGSLSAKEAGFGEDSEVQMIYYGHCSSGQEFYVSVILKTFAINQNSYPQEYLTGVFNYTTTTPFPDNPSDYFCRGIRYESFSSRIPLSEGWIYGEMIIRPYLLKPSPSANTQTNKVEK